jgi:4-amino-4-deoxy-L-arabinose transferase-like glycosyltransferase
MGRSLILAELQRSNSAHWRNLGILVLISLLLYFWQLGDIPFYERGEPREGLVVAEMVSSGNLILPQVNGEYIPFKPPLFHWLGVGAVKSLGRIDEFTLRLPSALLGMLGVLLTYWLGAQVWSARAGFIAGVILLSNIQWWIGATNVQVDMALAFFLIASVFSFLMLYRSATVRPWQSASLAILLACATLTKGPLGIVLPCLSFVIFLAWRRDFAFIKKLNPWRNGALFLFVVGSWYGLAIWQGGAPFILRQIIDENFRTATGEYGHPQPLYYFVPVLFSNLSLWSLFLLPLGISRWRRDPIWQRYEVTYLMIWIAVVFALFSLSSGKRAIYILPLYPAYALVLGAWWSEMEKNAKIDRVTLTVGYVIATIYLFAVVLVFRWPPTYLPKGQNIAFIARIVLENFELLRSGIIILSVAVLIAFAALYRKRLDYLFAAFATLAIFAVLIVKSIFYPTIAREQTFKPFVTRIAQLADAGAPLVFYRAFDAGVILYLHRHVRSYQDLAPLAQTPFYLLMWEEDRSRLNGNGGLELLATSGGTGPARRHHLTLVKAAKNLQP